MSSLADLEIQYQRLVAERNALGVRYEAGELNVLPQIKDLNLRIQALVIQIESLLAVNSSGDVVRDDQAARADRANPLDPPGGVLVLQNGRVTLPPDTTAGSNAQQFNLAGSRDSGTDSNLRPLVVTQGTNGQTAPGTGAGGAATPLLRPGPGQDTSAVPGGTPGVGAGGDDAGRRDLVSSLNAIKWEERVPTQDNVLGQYASYSYQASLYLIDRSNYQRI